MKKSPFSTPRGYGGHRKSHKMDSPYENKGYFYHPNNSFESSSPKVNSTHVENDDFIPFDSSSPSSFHDKPHSGQFSRPRGRRNNYSFGSQKSRSDNMSSTIYFDSSPTNHYGGTPRHRFSKSRNTPIDEIPISEFINLTDVLEDPWRNLMENHNKSRSMNKSNVSRTSCASDLNDVSMISMDNSELVEDSSKCSQEMEDDRTKAISDLSISGIVETKESR